MQELMTIEDIAQVLKLSSSYVRDKLVKRGDFPRPALAISQKCKRWESNDVSQWLKKQQTKLAR